VAGAISEERLTEMEDDKEKGHQTLGLEHLNSDSTTVIRSNEGDVVTGDTLQLITIEEAKFGDELLLGEVNGEPVKVLRPLNGVAVQQLGPIGMLIVVIHDRIVAVEKELAEIKKERGDDAK
jgi:hypothetical protein